MTLLAALRKHFSYTPERFFKDDEGSDLTALHSDARAAKKAIDEADDTRRDYLLDKAMIRVYPERIAQDN